MKSCTLLENVHTAISGLVDSILHQAPLRYCPGCRCAVRKWKDGPGCFVTLCAVVSAAELPSRESIYFRTKDGLRDLLLLLYCALP